MEQAVVGYRESQLSAIPRTRGPTRSSRVNRAAIGLGVLRPRPLGVGTCVLAVRDPVLVAVRIVIEDLDREDQSPLGCAKVLVDTSPGHELDPQLRPVV